MARPTAKQLVLKRWPNAHAYQWAGPEGWIIYLEDAARRGVGAGTSTARQAWEKARKHLRLRRVDRTGEKK